jgi:hypothetical protein
MHQSLRTRSSSLLGGLALAFMTGCGSGTLTDTSGTAGVGSDPAAGGSSTIGGAGTDGLGGSAGGAAGGAVGGAASLDPLSDPGLVAMRRLNRTQYNNTVRDLLGTELRPAASFPADDLLYGFDNIGQALNVSTLLFESFDDLFARPTSAQYAQFIVCDFATGGATCASQILQTFAERAWRRPVTTEEIAPFAGLVAQAATPDEGIRLAMQMVLNSAAFMFRLEFDANPDAFEPHALTGHELATRLSYLLWDSLPDDPLLTAAGAGEVLTDAGLATQLERMLADTKADAFIDDMAGMWLYSRKLDTLTRDYNLFPTWDDELRAAMQAETVSFFREFYQGDLPVKQMLTATFGFANQRLAEHYGVTGPTGDATERIELAGNAQRVGLLTQGTFLTATSRSTTTSPVVRGKWVLEQMLCTPPPPPPADVVADLDTPNFEGLTRRQRLEQHKEAGATCYSCHAVMDPIGLGLENYDAIGAYRTEDPDGLIDPSGELPGDPPQTFSGALELAQILGNDPRVERCVTQQIATYGLGARPSGPWLDALVSGASATGTSAVTLKSVLRTLVMSNAFRTRRAGPADTTTAMMPAAGATP